MKGTSCAPTTRMRKINRVSTPVAWRRGFSGTRCLLGVLVCGFSLPGAASMGHAGKKQPKPPIAAVRIAEGAVVNGEKKPVQGAIVYLENPLSLDIKSYLSDGNGHFHFSQLAPQTDYEVWAEQDGIQSKHKFISQFSNHTRFDFNLILDANKKKKLFGIL